MTFNPQSYSPAAAELIRDAKCNELGPGRPDENRRAALAALTPERLVAPHPLGDRLMALACLSGLWLRHDFLDESHKISQDIGSATGSFWHAIMHRREGDFDNAKYWFRRVHEHPVFESLCLAARRLAGSDPPTQAGYLADQTRWDPFEFVDLCRRSLDGPQSLRELCMNIQQREWELLFDDCFHRAIGK